MNCFRWKPNLTKEATTDSAWKINGTCWICYSWSCTEVICSPLCTLKKTFSHLFCKYRSRSPPEGKAMSPPQSAALPPSPTHTAPSVHTFAIPKTMGLGIILAGGQNRAGGPHISVERILAGMDAAKVYKYVQIKPLISCQDYFKQLVLTGQSWIWPIIE